MSIQKIKTDNRGHNWQGGKMEKICQWCGKTYLSWPYIAKISKYCSHSCTSKAANSGEKSHWWKGGKPEKICPYCGKTFQDYNGTRTTYCSKQCFDAIRRKRVNLICQNCGKIFEEKLSKSDHKFCSQKCNKDYLVREQSPHWKGGERGRKFYPKQWNGEFKRMIRERDNYTCTICKEYGNQVHHINYVKMDTNPENCITLCRSCHAKTNSNREYWISYFASYAP